MESASSPPAANVAPNDRTWLYAACAALVAILLWGAPLFLCQPLWADATHYDVLAQEVLRGRTLYVDVSDTNLPGAVWVHMAVRSIAGWRSEVLRAFDLLVVIGIAAVLMRLATVGRANPWPLRIFGIAAVLLYYFACTPMVHCQRDVWMLFFAALAVSLRFRQIASAECCGSRVFIQAILEGLLWGAAVWLKPYVLLPAIACFIAGLTFQLRVPSSRRKPLVLSTLGLILGGLLIGTAGSAWLIAAGSWSPMWDILLNWAGEYRSSGSPWKLRLATNLGWGVHYAPWSLLHLIAIPIAVMHCVNGFSSQDPKNENSRPLAASQLLLAILYLAWIIQASFIQLSHEYVLAVSMLIALPLLLSWDRIAVPSLPAKVGIAVFFAIAMIAHPFVQAKALSTWPLCFSEGSTPQVKDRLSTDAPRNVMGEAHWQDLAKVADYLRSRDIQDGQLASWDDSSQVLYTDLHVSPSSRFVHAANWLVFFPSRRTEIITEIQASHPHFIVTDVQMAGYSAYVAREDYQRDEPVFPKGMSKELDPYPWSEPIVFRAGRYLVHEVQTP